MKKSVFGKVKIKKKDRNCARARCRRVIPIGMRCLMYEDGRGRQQFICSFCAREFYG
jgi:hypothetical protein